MSRITRFSNARYTFDVNDTGPLDGPIVVLLHGFPETADSWSAVCADLHSRGLRTLTFNQRGYAPRAQPRGRYAYRVIELANDVVALARTIAPAKIHLVGHDWGALVAWTVAARSPESIETLTTVSVPHAAAFRRSMFTSDQARRSYYMAIYQIPWLPELIARRKPNWFRAALAASGMQSAEVERVINDLVPTPALSGALNWYRAIPFATKADRASHGADYPRLVYRRPCAGTARRRALRQPSTPTTDSKYSTARIGFPPRTRPNLPASSTPVSPASPLRRGHPNR